MAEKNIEALNLSKVKDITKLVIKPNSILIKITELKKSSIIGAEVYNDAQNIIWHVFMVGSNVSNINVGDLVLDVNMAGASFLKHGEDKYVLMDSYNVMLYTAADNYTI